MLSPWFMAIIAAVSNIFQGIAGYQANRQNAAYAEAEAKQAKLTAAAEAARTRRQVAAQQGEFVAGVGAQGTTFEGSPMEAYINNAIQGELMAQDKIYEGKLKERAFKMQRDMYKRQAFYSLFSAVTGAQQGGSMGNMFQPSQNSGSGITPASSGNNFGNDFGDSSTFGSGGGSSYA